MAGQMPPQQNSRRQHKPGLHQTMSTDALTARARSPLPRGTNHQTPKSWSVKATGNLLGKKRAQGIASFR